jgi:hypothetical protein
MASVRNAGLSICAVALSLAEMRAAAGFCAFQMFVVSTCAQPGERTNDDHKEEKYRCEH